MATKWVAQMPNPAATPAATIQTTRARPAVERARLKILTAVRLAKKQTTAATPTRRQSCWTVRQLRTWNTRKPTRKIRATLQDSHLCFVNRTAARRDGLFFVPRNEFRRQSAQPLQVDAARARDVAHGEVDRRKPHVLRKMLVPFGAAIGAGDQLFQDRTARALVGGERRGNIAVRGQRLVERAGVFHGEPRAGADGKMCGVQRVAQQHAVAMRPARIVHQRKLPPDRIVRDQRMAVEHVGENAFAKTDRLHLAHAREAGAFESRLVHFDQERAALRFVAIMMRVERTVLGFDKSLRERLETHAVAVPGETIGEMADTGAKLLGMRAAHQRIDAVGADDEVVTGKFVQALDGAAIDRSEAGGASARLQQLQEMQPPDGGKADAVDHHALTAQTERHVGPR